jgi:type IV pilus assembly protein PilA
MNMKKRSKKGFTLIEMLIVIAIIAILAAIAIPTFSAQLDKANQAVDDANLRTATSLAMADYMLESYSGTKYYSATEGEESGMAIISSDTTYDTAPTDFYPGSEDPTEYIQITIVDGAVTDATWL